MCPSFVSSCYQSLKLTKYLSISLSSFVALYFSTLLRSYLWIKLCKRLCIFQSMIPSIDMSIHFSLRFFPRNRFSIFQLSDYQSQHDLNLVYQFIYLKSDIPTLFRYIDMYPSISQLTFLFFWQESYIYI